MIMFISFFLMTYGITILVFNLIKLIVHTTIESSRLKELKRNNGMREIKEIKNFKNWDSKVINLDKYRKR